MKLLAEPKALDYCPVPLGHAVSSVRHNMRRSHANKNLLASPANHGGMWLGLLSLAKRHRHGISILSISATAVDTVQRRRIFMTTCLRRCRLWQSSHHTLTPKHEFY